MSLVSLAYIAEVAIGIGLLIFVHEFGHFIVAKLSKVKVEKFSLGFGPELVGFTGGDTRYSLRVIPLGGYVKMLGDEPGSDVETFDKEHSFLTQSFTKKALIVVAGSFMNILTALVLFVAVFRIGITFPAARVGSVEYGSPAYYAGFKVGDRIVSVDGSRDVDFMDLTIKAALADPGQKLSMIVERDGKEVPLTVYPAFSRELGMSFIGIGPYPSLKIQGFEGFDSTESPGQKAGLQTGWTMTSFNGQPLGSAFELERDMAANGLRPFALGVKTDSTETTIRITPVRNPRPLLGISPIQTTEITEVAKGSQAALMGLQSSDTIVALGSEEVGDVLTLRNDITENEKRLPPLRVIRDGKSIGIRWNKPPVSAFDFVTGFRTTGLTKLAWVEPDSPADVIGLRPGDVVTSVDGAPVSKFQDIQQAMKSAKGDTIAVSWTRDGQEMSGSFQPAFVGILPGMESIREKLGLAASCRVGVQKAWSFASQVYLLVKKAFHGQPTIAKNLRGPVSIAQTSYQVAQRGVTDFLFFLAIIGINLGVVNLLPIPVLDGGLLAVFVVERIKGSPLSATSQAILQYIGLAIIVALFLYVTFNDILRLSTGG